MLSVWIKYGGIGSWDVRLVFTTFLHSIRLFLSNFNEIFLISILFLCCWCVVGAQNQASTTGKKKSEEEMFHKECVDIHQAKCIQFHSLCNEMMNEKQPKNFRCSEIVVLCFSLIVNKAKKSRCDVDISRFFITISYIELKCSKPTKGARVINDKENICVASNSHIQHRYR